MSDIQEIITQARLCGWRTPGRVIRLCDEIERLKTELHAAGDGDTWRDACKRCETEIERLTRERDEREQAARRLHDLWPAEYFGTLTSIVDDHSWLEDEPEEREEEG